MPVSTANSRLQQSSLLLSCFPSLLATYLCRLCKIKKKWLLKLPEDIPVHSGVEAFMIPGDDARTGLRSKLGLRLRADGVTGKIAKGEIIGGYRGLVLLAGDLTKLIINVPAGWRQSGFKQSEFPYKMVRVSCDTLLG